ncbi:hypothetical protein AMTR_s00023p00172000 [Amborella trichopoda]|uniref:Uncharacterized protein n=1 Tax=Amborella trichopoda TaxID=13333 RepID=W1NK82_AMBTC|nr:hypothetical protein AMTR_s00023p00172000 [Amborella trichopoda]
MESDQEVAELFNRVTKGMAFSENSHLKGVRMADLPLQEELKPVEGSLRQHLPSRLVGGYSVAGSSALAVSNIDSNCVFGAQLY